MKPTRFASTLLLICVLLCACGHSAAPQSPSSSAASAQAEASKPQRATVDPKKFAIIVSGVGGEEAYTKKFTTQASQIYDAFTNKLGFDEKQVYLLTENATGGPENGNITNIARSTADEVRKALTAIKAAATAESFIALILIGHGSFDGQQAKFNLVGPDLTTKDYASLLDGLPTRRIVVVNTASSSGEFIKPLSSKDRVLITATRSGNEQNVTIFAEHFITALTSQSADLDKSGRTSLMELFTYASKQTADWYKQKTRLATEHALIDDNGDGVGHEEGTGGDGGLARTTYFDSKTLEEANADAEVFKLLEDRQRLEQEIEKLKARKDEMKAEEYEAELERLLVELATTNQKIKARKKQ